MPERKKHKPSVQRPGRRVGAGVDGVGATCPRAITARFVPASTVAAISRPPRRTIDRRASLAAPAGVR